MPGWQRKKYRGPNAAKQARAAAAEEAAEQSKQSELLTRAEMVHWEEEFGSLGRGTVAVAAFLASGELPASADDDDLLPPRRPFERKRAVSLPLRRFDGGSFGGGIEFVASPARPTSLVVDDFSPPISPTPGGLDAYLAARQVLPSKTSVQSRNRRFSAPLLSSLRNELPAIDSDDGHAAGVEPTTVEEPVDIEEPIEIDYTEDYFGWGATHEEASTHAPPTSTSASLESPPPANEPDVLEAALEDLSDWGAAYEAVSTDRAPDTALLTPTPMPQPSPSKPATREVVAEPPRPSPYRRLSTPIASPLRREIPIARSEGVRSRLTPTERPVDFGEDDSDSVPLGLIHPGAAFAPKAASPTLLEPSRPNSIAWPSRPRFHIPRGSIADSTTLRPKLADNRRHSTLGFGEIQDRSASVIGHRDDAERILMGWKAPVPAPEAQHDASSVTNPFFLPYRMSAKPASKSNPSFLKSKLDPSTVTNPHFLPQHKPRKPTPSAFPSTVRPRPKSLAFPSLSAPAIPRLSPLAPAHTFRTPTPFDFSSAIKRNTLIEISQNIGQNTVRGTHEKPARLDRTPATERIVVGDWSAKLTPKPQPKPRPRIMELNELEQRHKRKLKQMQDPVVKSVKEHNEVVIAKSAYAQRQQLEAAEQRKHERAREGRRRSFATLTILPHASTANLQPSLASPSSPTEFATMKRMSAVPRSVSSPNLGATGPRPEPAVSMGGHRGSMMSIDKVAMWQGGSPARPAQAVLGKLPPASQHASQAPSASEAPTIKPKSKFDWLGY